MTKKIGKNMDRILVFAGTTEGRMLSSWLCKKNTGHTLCIATEYGEQVLTEHPCAHVKMGRMDAGQIAEFMKNEGIEVVVDATHPYAAVVTENIKEATAASNVRYLRLDRNRTYKIDEDSFASELQTVYFENA